MMANVMILFGSGGHSAEMIMLVRNANLTNILNQKELAKLVCVISDDDHLVEEKIDQEFRRSRSLHKLDKIRTKRSRRIGQSYLSAVWTTLTGILSSISIIISHRPQICLTNGPAISVTTCIAIRCLNLLTLFRYKCQIIYVESFCRTRTLSLSGKIIYYMRLADQFYVQWPTLADRYHRSLYKGILI